MFEVAHGTTLPPLPSSMSQEMHEFVVLCLQVVRCAFGMWWLQFDIQRDTSHSPACVARLSTPSLVLFSRFCPARSR
jgi:hypothetical protein